jgi:hypothetical protein
MKKMLGFFFFLLLVAVPNFSDAEELSLTIGGMGERAGSYLTTSAYLEALSFSKCGYAIDNMQIRLEEVISSDILDSFPTEDKPEVEKFLSQMIPQMRKEAETFTQDLIADSTKRLGGEAGCGFSAGMMFSMYAGEKNKWEKVKEAYRYQQVSKKEHTERVFRNPIEQAAAEYEEELSTGDPKILETHFNQPFKTYRKKGSSFELSYPNSWIQVEALRGDAELFLKRKLEPGSGTISVHVNDFAGGQGELLKWWKNNPDKIISKLKKTLSRCRDFREWGHVPWKSYCLLDLNQLHLKKPRIRG